MAENKSETLSLSSSDGEVQTVQNRWSEHLCFQKMNVEAIVPSKKSDSAAGLDLHSFEDVSIPAWSKQIIGTKIKMTMPPGVYGRIASRSGLSCTYDLEVGAGVVDADYQGEIKVVLRNFSDLPYTVKKGERIAQLILERCMTNVSIKEVTSLTDLFGKTTRGAGGFGSTGQT